MSRIVLLIIVAGLVILAAAAININSVDARQEAEFIQVSVLAEHQADYGVNEQAIAIPAVSAEIIADAAQDSQTQSSVQIITYTSLPTKEPKRDSAENEDIESVDEAKHNNGQGNGNGGGNGNTGNQGNNGNGGSPQNGGNGNGNQNQNGNDSGNAGNENRKDREKESRKKR